MRIGDCKRIISLCLVIAIDITSVEECVKRTSADTLNLLLTPVISGECVPLHILVLQDGPLLIQHCLAYSEAQAL